MQSKKMNMNKKDEYAASSAYSSKEIAEGLKKMKERIEMADNVNHPVHYGRENAIECIDEMIMIFGKETVKDFCKCNAWKYRYRAADKNGAEDIAKSDWYMNKYKELCEAKTRCLERESIF